VLRKKNYDTYSSASVFFLVFIVQNIAYYMMFQVVIPNEQQPQFVKVIRIRWVITMLLVIKIIADIYNSIFPTPSPKPNYYEPTRLPPIILEFLVYAVMCWVSWLPSLQIDENLKTEISIKLELVVQSEGVTVPQVPSPSTQGNSDSSPKACQLDNTNEHLDQSSGIDTGPNDRHESE